MSNWAHVTDADLADMLDRWWTEHETLLAGPRKTELEHAISAAHLELGRRQFEHVVAP